MISWNGLLSSVKTSSAFSGLPVVWIIQRIMGLKPINSSSLTTRELSSEIENRKYLFRWLNRVQKYFLGLAALFLSLELLRQPSLWILAAIARPGTFFDYTFYAGMYYLTYGFTLLLLALFVAEILRLSAVPALQVDSEAVQKYDATDLVNTALVSLLPDKEEDPRDRFVRKLRTRNYINLQPQPSIFDQSSTNLFNESQFYLRTQRTSGSPFGRHSPNKSWSESPNRSFNRTFGSSGSGSRTSSPASCLMAATDWDINDRMEVDAVCGKTALERLQEEQSERQRSILVQEDTIGWMGMANVRDMNYQTSSMFRIPSPKRVGGDSTSRADVTNAEEDFTMGDKAYPSEDFSWIQLQTSVEQLHLWTENLRIWMSDTIIRPLLVRIDEVNEKLYARLRLENVIGNQTPDQLRMIAQQYRHEIPILLQVIPFLELSIQQDYVVQRLRDLAKDGVLGEYTWNSGGSYFGQQWSDPLPTDAALVMHCFVTFMDVVQPPDPLAPNLRAFSHKHVLRNMRSWKAETRDKPMIHQAVSGVQPKYEIFFQHHFLQLVEGKNNLFHAILLFARLLYLQEKKGQGYANLGPGRAVFDVFNQPKLNERPSGF